MIVSNSTDTFFRTGVIDQRGRTSTDATIRREHRRDRQLRGGRAYHLGAPIMKELGKMALRLLLSRASLGMHTAEPRINSTACRSWRPNWFTDRSP